MMMVNGPVPSVLYRFMDAAHVDDFCAGRFWLSTIVICRETEDRGRKDADEGKDIALIDAAHGAEIPDGFLRAFGGDRHSEPSFVFASTYIRGLPDAHVLCFSREFNPANMTGKYGQACVEINDPVLFGERLTKHLMQMPHHDIKAGGMAPVCYTDRERPYDAPKPPLGFVKPLDPFGPDLEYRMRWWLNSGMPKAPLTRIADVNCPGLSSLSRRIA
jgi:hypothetical protein